MRIQEYATLDPKVFWMDSQKKWILTLAAGQETQFFSSPNLIEWTFLSSFQRYWNHEGVWECPDLFELKVNGSEETKWVHLVSINPGGPNGGSATQYFVGDFDGINFTLDPNFKTEMEKAHHFWTDFGKDNYAGVTFSNWRTKRKPSFFRLDVQLAICDQYLLTNGAVQWILAFIIGTF